MTRRPVVRGAIAASALASFALATTGHETPGHAANGPGTTAVKLTLASTVGNEANHGSGWVENAVRVENVSGVAQRGTLRMRYPRGYSDEAAFVTESPFSVPAGQSVLVKLPAMGVGTGGPYATVSALREDGTVLAEATSKNSSDEEALLVVVDESAGLGVALRGWPLSGLWASRGYTTNHTLSVGTVSMDPSTGEPVLPDHGSSWSSATVVLVPSSRLLGMSASSREALSHWVLSGGWLAIVPDRPEDLRSPLFASFFGAEVKIAPVHPELLRFPTLERAAPLGAPTLVPPEPDPEGDPEPEPGTHGPTPTVPHGPTPPPHVAPPKPTAIPMAYVPTSTSPTTGATRIGPTVDVRAKLRSFTGGNLHATGYGDAASYGLGEVHLLAFDPTKRPMVDDAWVHGRMIALVNDARNHQALVPFASGSFNGSTMYGGSGARETVRRALDPNENFRPALGIAAIILILYSIVVGPVTYLRAQKKQKPFAPLFWVPAWATGAFILIVLVGFATKGVRGRARTIAFADVAAGFSRGPVTRFRGFFSPQTRNIDVAATDRTGLVSAFGSEGFGSRDGLLKVDRDAARLAGVTLLPWETYVVREDAYMDVGGGVSIVPTPDKGFNFTNKTGKPLAHVVVWVPDAGFYWFPQMGPGDTFSAKSGRLLGATTLRAPNTWSGIVVHPLVPSAIVASLGSSDASSFVSGWGPVEDERGFDIFPDGVPVILAEVEGGEGVTSDSGFKVDSERLLLRVVGVGGT
ncbi:MAG: hypothetical protein U0169_25085 [Polyangiaceae bacterium]